jgi:gamma-glutamylaminecyclotransferase
MGAAIQHHAVRLMTSGRLFVFGTLKRGFPLHERGLAGATFRGSYRTSQRFPMVIAGPWFAPMMFDQPGKGHQVMGELYDIEAERWPVLDALESIGVEGNFSRTIDVESEDGGVRCQACVYMKTPALAVPIHSDFLAAYQDARFIPPEER